MDGRLHEWMVPTIMRVEPWCEETVIAAGPFRVVGGRTHGGDRGVVGRLLGISARGERGRGGELPEDVILAVGETTLSVFAHEIGQDLNIVVEEPLRVWWRNDVIAHADEGTEPIKLTLDVTSTGDRHELESTATTGMPGKVTREIIRLLDDPSIGAPTLAHALAVEHRPQRFGEIADEIEAELKRLGWWMPRPPAEEAVVGGGAFGMEAVAFPTWLQVVFVKRLRQAAAGELEIPRWSSVSAFATREFDGYHDDTSRLMSLLHEVDRLVEL